MLATLGLALYLFFTRNFDYWQKRSVPGLKPTPFWGNVSDLFLLRLSTGEFLRRMHLQIPDAPCIGFFIFNRPALLIKKPELIKKILVKDFDVFLDRVADSDVETDPIGQRNLFIIKGELWKYLRNHLSPIFTSGRMKKMFHLVSICNEQLVEYIEHAEITERGILDIKEISAKCTTDVISTCAFGIKSNSLSDPKAEFREFGRLTFFYTVSRALEILFFFFLPSLVKFLKLNFLQKDANEFLRTAFWDTIKAREESKMKRDDLIDLLIELKNKGKIETDANDDKEAENAVDNKLVDKFDFNGDDLVAQAAIFFVAGFETSATTMSLALYELALHPDLQKRLREEIRENLEKNDGKITYEMVFGLKYLDMVVSETLRKYPPLPILDRITLKDYYDEDTGITIEKGTPVYIGLQGLHGDPKYFPNPDQFDPERFSDEAKKTRVPFTYLPFGEGPHYCIGKRFGLMSSKTGIVYVLANFEVEPCADTPIPLILNTRGLVITTAGGLPLKFIKSSV